MTTTELARSAAKAEAAAALTRKPVGVTPITDAVYPKKGAQRKPVEPRPVRPSRPTFVGELLPPSQAAALVALQAELESAKPKKRRRKPTVRPISEVAKQQAREAGF